MDLGRVPIFAMLKAQMGWLGERQTLLAENVASADTPGFRPRDLKPLDFGAVLRGGGGGRLDPVVTAPRHLVAAHGPAAVAVAESAEGEATLNGNSVSLESEMMKMAETQTDYELAANLYRKHLSLVRIALGSR